MANASRDRLRLSPIDALQGNGIEVDWADGPAQCRANRLPRGLFPVLKAEIMAGPRGGERPPPPPFGVVMGPTGRVLGRCPGTPKHFAPPPPPPPLRWGAPNAPPNFFV